MTKKQRQDSEQEKAVSVVGGIIAYIPSYLLKPGDLIATAIKVDKKTGNEKALKSKVIKKVAMGRGCRNVHVNDDECWDICASVPVVVSA